MLSIISVLAMFSLLVICSFVFYWSKKIGLPYTVMLVLVGIFLVILSESATLNPFFGFLTTFKLTPELLFYIFLPTLIFESAFNMNIRNISDNIWSISILSVLGLLISTSIITLSLYLLLPLFGLQIPFIILLLFASIISATDPVAVLALFKEYGAPKRLTLIFEGESLFNDGTAVALFLVVLAVAQKGFHGFDTILGGIATFLMMIILGIAFGLFMAMIFTRFLQSFKTNEFVSITLLIVSAHLIFILSELINTNAIFGIHFHISPIIATTFGALFLGNYAKHILSPKSEEYIDKSVAHLAFVINSLVFILIGILFATTPLNFGNLILPILATIVVVAIARAISIYSTIIPLNKLKLEKPIPMNWQHLLSWGSLRGALAIIIVLQIPNDFTILGWNFPYTPKEFLIAITSGCILATLFVKATTIKKFMDKFNVYDNNIFDKLDHVNISLMCSLNEKKKIVEHIERKFIIQNTDNNSDKLISEINEKISHLKNEKSNLENSVPKNTLINYLKLKAISIEFMYLKELYDNNEISEKVYRRIFGKLTIQKEKCEELEMNEINVSMYRDKKDIFDNFISFILSPFSKDRNLLNLRQQLEYYRAQTIISRKVVKNLSDLNSTFESQIYSEEILKTVIDIYETYRMQSNNKFMNIINNTNEEVLKHLNYLNSLAVQISSKKSLQFISEKGIIDLHHLENYKSELKMLDSKLS